MKKMLVTALICIGVGIAVCGAAYAISGNQTNADLSDSVVYFPAGDIDKISIKEHVASIKIFKSGDNSGDIMIKAENIVNGEFKASEKNGVLEISYNPNMTKIGILSMPRINFGITKTPVINIYLPEGKLFDEINFNGGVGTISAEYLNAQSVYIDGGVGTVDVKNMTAENLKVDGGVGTIKINGTVNGSTRIDGGVGTVDITGELNGDVKLATGVGSASLNLTGDVNDYNVRANTGVGTIRLNGAKISDSGQNGGKYSMNIDAGVGSININIR